MQYSDQLLQAIENYLDGKATVAEQQLVKDWYHSFDDTEVNVDANHAAYEKLVEARLRLRIQESTGIIQLSTEEVETVKLWPRLIGVAAAVAAIVFGIWFYNSRTEILRGALDDKSVVYQNDIAPGKNTATIKIGDGEAITLSDKQTGVIVGDELRYTDNSVVSNSTNKRSLPYGRDDGMARMLTVTTPRGGTYQVTLPDGTKVWLNAASVLTYTMPLKERGGIRKVELSGEAYFEVIRNKNQPFVVATKNLTTTVLGTHFNISAYDDERSAKATLLEGSVRVHHLSSSLTTPSSRGKRSDEGSLGHATSRDLSYRRDDVRGGEAIILKPNQQASVSGSSGINVKEVDAADAILWKSGKFSFAREEIGSIMKQASRWYDVEIVFQDNVQEIKVNGSVSRFANISVLLEKLEQTGLVHFKLEGRKVIVTK